MTGGTPMVSVIMPVYNAVQFVGESIRSILDQSYGDLELIVVDDGSTDGSTQVIAAFDDPRLHFLRQANSGVAHALNQAMALAKGNFIARQDADDIALPERLAAQVERFTNHPSLVICGTWARVIDERHNDLGHLHHPTSDPWIQYALLFDSPFVSSTVMFRRPAQETLFEDSDRVFEDYDMWSRLARTGTCANIAKELLLYRELASGLSHTTSNSRERVVEQRQRNLSFWNNGPHPLIGPLANSGFEHPSLDPSSLRAACRLLRHITKRFQADPATRRALEREIHRRLLGFRLHRHSTMAFRVLDRLHKEWVLWSA